MTIKRTSSWLQADNNNILTWVHHSSQFNKSKAVLIVGPIGPEYMHCYRSIRCLADALAEQGILAARYDHPGMGDSTGNLDVEDIWHDWVKAPQVVSNYLCSEYLVENVVVISLRSASLLLDDCIKSSNIKEVVYWYPYVRGASFIRDMQSLDSMLNLESISPDGALNAGGYPLTVNAQKFIKSINLSKSNFSGIQRALVIESIDLPGNTKFLDNLRRQNVQADMAELDGLTKMVRRAILSLVPFSNINYISNWIEESIQDSVKLTKIVESDEILKREGYIETIVHIPSTQEMYGVFTQSNSDIKLSDSTLIIFSNAGVAHHIGPNRIYVDASRSLALQGIATLRFDISSIGESVGEYSEENHHPYPITAAQDINTAVNYMRAKFSFKRVILSGLSSGAHNSYHAALTGNSDVNGLILINPLTFYWRVGQSLFAPEEHKDEIDAAYYQNKMFDYEKWVKLLLSPKKILSVTGFVFRMLLSKLRSSSGVLLKKAGLVKLSEFEKDISLIFKKNITISVLYSDSDPGYRVLMSQAGLIVKRGVKKGLFYSELIKNADHTFSSLDARKKLISCIASSVKSMR